MPGVGTQMVDATSYLSQGFGPIPGVRIYLLIKVIVIRFKVSLCFTYLKPNLPIYKHIAYY